MHQACQKRRWGPLIKNRKEVSDGWSQKPPKTVHISARGTFKIQQR